MVDDILEYSHEFNSSQEMAKRKLEMRGIEQSLEIIGEALKRILVIEDTILISDAKKIIGLRNIIAHAYDNVDVSQLYDIVKNHLPKLKAEVDSLLFLK